MSSKRVSFSENLVLVIYLEDWRSMDRPLDYTLRLGVNQFRVVSKPREDLTLSMSLKKVTFAEKLATVIPNDGTQDEGLLSKRMKSGRDVESGMSRLTLDGDSHELGSSRYKLIALDSQVELASASDSRSQMRHKRQDGLAANKRSLSKIQTSCSRVIGHVDIIGSDSVKIGNLGEPGMGASTNGFVKAEDEVNFQYDLGKSGGGSARPRLDMVEPHLSHEDDIDCIDVGKNEEVVPVVGHEEVVAKNHSDLAKDEETHLAAWDAHWDWMRVAWHVFVDRPHRLCDINCQLFVDFLNWEHLCDDVGDINFVDYPRFLAYKRYSGAVGVMVLSIIISDDKLSGNDESEWLLGLWDCCSYVKISTMQFMLTGPSFVLDGAASSYVKRALIDAHSLYVVSSHSLVSTNVVTEFRACSKLYSAGDIDLLSALVKWQHRWQVEGDRMYKGEQAMVTCDDFWVGLGNYDSDIDGLDSCGEFSSQQFGLQRLNLKRNAAVPLIPLRCRVVLWTVQPRSVRYEVHTVGDGNGIRNAMRVHMNILQNAMRVVDRVVTFLFVLGIDLYLWV